MQQYFFVTSNANNCRFTETIRTDSSIDRRVVHFVDFFKKRMRVVRFQLDYNQTSGTTESRNVGNGLVFGG